MKLKYIAITVLITASLLLFTGMMNARGLYSNSNSSNIYDADKSTTTSSTQGNIGGLFRSNGWDTDPGEGDKDPDPGDDSPIGEGLLVLSLLSAGYALVKRNVRKKYES